MLILFLHKVVLHLKSTFSILLITFSILLKMKLNLVIMRNHVVFQIHLVLITNGKYRNRSLFCNFIFEEDIIFRIKVTYLNILIQTYSFF